MSLLFENLWVKRTPSTAIDRDPLDVIEAYVPRGDYPFEVVELVSLLVGAEGGACIEVPVRALADRL